MGGLCFHWILYEYVNEARKRSCSALPRDDAVAATWTSSLFTLPEGSSGATTSTITAEVAAANAAAMVGKKNNLGKKGNQRNIMKQNHSSSSNKKKKQTTSKAIAHSDTSDISSSGEDVKDNDKRKKSPKDKRNHTHLSASSNRKIPSKSFFSDIKAIMTSMC